MSIVRIGVLSTANIATRSVIPAINNLPDKFKLVGIASRFLDKAEKASQDLNTQAFGDYSELVTLPDIDAIYIPLPNGLHFQWVKECLKAGKHVLVEKSLGCSYSEVKELTELARSNKCVLLENFQFRFHQQLVDLKRLLFEDEVIGELRVLRAFFGFPPFPDKDNIRYNSELGGGALLDAGAYTLKISQLLIGFELEVLASRLSFDEHSSVDIWGNGMLSVKNQPITAHISFGFDNYYQNGIEAWGNKGKLFTNRLFTARDNFKPIIEIETNDGKRVVELNADDHFQNMLSHFHTLITEFNESDIELEHRQNLNQSRLIEDFKSKANAK